MRPNAFALARCECGQEPHLKVNHAGPVRLYSVVCGQCGERTFESEDEGDVVGAWNDDLAVGHDSIPYDSLVEDAAAAGDGRFPHAVRREILTKILGGVGVPPGGGPRPEFIGPVFPTPAPPI